jgi:hypothetical protein
MKKMFMLMIVCILALTCSFSAMAEPNRKAASEKGIVKILQGSIKDSDHGLTYNTSAYYNYGPDDFIVLNDSEIIILDNVSCRLQHYKSGVYYETIPLPEGNEYIRLCYSSEGKIYVLSTAFLMEVNLATKDQTFYCLPNYEEFGYYVEAIIERNRQIILITETLGDFALNKETGKFENAAPDYLVYREGGLGGKEIEVSIGDLSWTVDASNSFGYPLGTDHDNNLFFYCFNMDHSISDPEYCQILKYAQDGNLVASSSVDTSKWAHTPRTFAHVSEEGNIYLLGLYADSFIIYKINGGEGDVAEPGMKTPEYTVDGDFAYSDDSPEMNRAMTMSDVTLSRFTVQTRALGMINLSWTLASGNDRWSTFGATKPACFNGASVPSSQTGIPYCWGKYNGYSTVSGGTKFSTAITTLDTDGVTRKYVAGNAINHDPVISRTVGLDCTGFVCSAYGFSAHQYSGNFYSDTTCFTTISSSDLVRMDLIIKTGHAILFKAVSNSSTGSLMVCESLLNGSTDKTITNARTINDLNGLGYIYRRPNAWIFCSHDTLSNYKYNSGSHWKICEFCDAKVNQAPHSFVLQPSGLYKCSACGYTTNSVMAITPADGLSD